MDVWTVSWLHVAYLRSIFGAIFRLSSAQFVRLMMVLVCLMLRLPSDVRPVYTRQTEDAESTDVVSRVPLYLFHIMSPYSVLLAALNRWKVDDPDACPTHTRRDYTHFAQPRAFHGPSLLHSHRLTRLKVSRSSYTALSQMSCLTPFSLLAAANRLFIWSDRIRVKHRSARQFPSRALSPSRSHSRMHPSGTLLYRLFSSGNSHQVWPI